LRACFLIHELGRSGGAQTVLRYARALDGSELVVTGTHVGELPADLDGVPVRRLAEVRGAPYEVAIATWWATAASLWEVEAERRIVFLQSIESRFYEERHWYERFAAEQVLALPVSYVVVADWMRALLAELRPDAPCWVVRNGIDKATFAPPAAGPQRDRAELCPSPLRVLIEGQPSMWFKGVDDALAATRAMAEPASVTVVAGEPSASPPEGARVVGGLDPAGMAALYAEHDVLLKLSRVESLGLAPIEAFHVGVPAVVAPYTGHEEYLEHGRNGLVVGFDDVPGTARALDSLARDRERLRELSQGALLTAAGWPAADEAAREFGAGVRELAAMPPPDPDAALVHLQRAQRRWLELGREHVRQADTRAEGLRGEVEWNERALAQAIEHHEELDRELRTAEEHGKHMAAQIESITESRSYRLAQSLRRLKP
jgi:O-antigen biosynthesis protein